MTPATIPCSPTPNRTSLQATAPNTVPFLQPGLTTFQHRCIILIIQIFLIILEGLSKRRKLYGK